MLKILLACRFVLLCCIGMGSYHQVYASNTSVESNLTAPVNITNESTSEVKSEVKPLGSIQPTISQFVLGDFDAQMDILNNWHESPEALQKLITALENDQLYANAIGNAYLLQADNSLTDYATGKAAPVAVETLNAISLNNAMRTAIDALKAKTDLQSSDLAKRQAAIQVLTDNPEALDDALLTQRLSVEKDPQMLKMLNRLQAQKNLQSADTARQLAGATALSSSNEPEMLALVQTKLADSSISPTLKAALEKAQSSIARRIKMSEWGGYLFSGLSMASILLLAALGLAITYGLLGVINMAHGELIMIGAYTTYVMQGFFNHYLAAYADAYLLAAIPAAFCVSAVIGMIIERVVIKPLYGRQLETLLATFGVSLILMQLVRMIFGAQNVEVSNASWMSGGIVMSPSLTIPYSRIVIIGFTLAVLVSVKLLISHTRFGLFIRAVTQNRQMAQAIGVRSSRIDMLAFGLGSGLAGLAGCALSQIGNVGPNLGQDYIIDAFLVVVVGGVGQLSGALLAAFGLGISGKFLEVAMGPVLAKILLLVLIILFIQRRPQGLFALKGRFVE